MLDGGGFGGVDCALMRRTPPCASPKCASLAVEAQRGHCSLKGPINVGILAARVCFTQASCALPASGWVQFEETRAQVKPLALVNCMRGHRHAGNLRRVPLWPNEIQFVPADLHAFTNGKQKTMPRKKLRVRDSTSVSTLLKSIAPTLFSRDRKRERCCAVLAFSLVFRQERADVVQPDVFWRHRHEQMS